MDMDPHVSTSWDTSPAKGVPSHPPSHLSTHLQTPSLSTSQEQGRTLELEREMNKEKIEGGKEEEEEKHQHLPVDSINLFNIIMVSSRE